MFFSCCGLAKNLLMPVISDQRLLLIMDSFARVLCLPREASRPQASGAYLCEVVAGGGSAGASSTRFLLAVVIAASDG